MKRRQGKGVPTDLLVCFPTRAAHLTLMPKAICIPVQAPAGLNNNSHSKHHRRKSSIGGGGSHGSPFMSKQMGTDCSEPTSPRITCAGQIKVRPRPGPRKSWQSVMEDIERLHNNKQKKRPTLAGPLGFLTCLRSLKFDFRCFGSFPNVNVTSDDDEDEDQDQDQEQDHEEHDHHRRIQKDIDDQAKDVFSKWFTVLQENQHPGIVKEENCIDIRERENSAIDDPPCGPPPNALVLMRCRSAPAKSWQEEKEEEENKGEEMEKRKLEKKRNLELRKEEEEKKREGEILEKLMKCESDFYKFSSDIAKETWVVGGIKDILTRTRSMKR